MLTPRIPAFNLKATVMFETIITILILSFCSPGLHATPTVASSGGHGGAGGGAMGPSSTFINRIEMRKREKAIKERQRKEQKEWEEFEKSFENIGTPSKPSKPVRRARPRPSPKLPQGHPETLGSLKSRSFLLQRSMSGIDNEFAQKVWRDPVGSLRKYKARQKSAARKGDIAYKHKTHMDLGNVYYLLGLYSKAKDSFVNAADTGSDKLSEDKMASAMNSVAAVNETTGDYDSARRSYRGALETYRRRGDMKGQSRTLMNLGVMAMNRGNFEAAANYYDQSLKMAETSDRSSSVMALMNAGKGFRKWGFVRESIGRFDKAIMISKEMGDHVKTSQLMKEKAQALIWLDKPDEALRVLQEALEQIKKSGRKAYEVNHLIAGLMMDQGKLDHAEDYVKKSKYNSDRARLALLRKDFKKARRLFNALRKTALKSNRISDLFVAHLGLGIIYERQGKQRSADKEYAKAVDISEDMREGLLLSERPKFFVAPVNGFKPIEAGDGLIRTRIKTKRIADSIYPGEVTKARCFADSIGRRADVSRLGLPRDLLQEEEGLFNRLASLRKALEVLPKHKASARYSEISRQIRKAEKEIARFERKVKSSHKEYAAVRYPSPVKLSKARLVPDRFYLIYDVTETGVAIRLLKGKSVIGAAFQDIGLDELTGMAREFRLSFEQARLGSFNTELAKRLYRLLVSPVIEKVPQGADLVVVSDDTLSIIPFEALVEKGRIEWKAADWGPYPSGLTYLFDRNPITIRQSLTSITLSSILEFGENDGKSLLVLADPVFQASDDRVGRAYASKPKDRAQGSNVRVMEAMNEYSKLGFQLTRLKATGRLADRLKQMFPSDAKIFKGLSASRNTLLKAQAKRLAEYRWMVLATHGYAAADMPGLMEPFIALSMVPGSQDGFITMSEVLEMDLNADLVALTACQTGHGRVIPGEGVMSLGRAFQCAGARSALVSLWSVSEITSVKLMEIFFERLKSGKKIRRAWREARKELRSMGYDHPFFWAPFVLIGDTD